MGGQQRVYKQRIRSTETLAKVFRAMELIAASRIAKAREQASFANPFDVALTKAVAAVAMHSNMEHPMLKERTDTNRVAVLAVTSDRGMAGAYSATILRATDKHIEELRERGKEPMLFTSGRRAQSYYHFRGVEVEKEWMGHSDSPDPDTADDIAQTLLEHFLAPADEGGVDELHIVFTRFHNMVRQTPEIRKILPMKVVDETEAQELHFSDNFTNTDSGNVLPLYDFEPSADEVLAMLLPMYVKSRIRNALLQSAASELANRQRAMHTANDNAQELIGKYTRLANSARQAEITTEITEIVSGADALASN